jgi:type I restriction enzyme R subunit
LRFFSLKDYTRQKVREQYHSLDNFLQKWNATDKKLTIIEQLTEQGIVFADLKAAVDKEMDIFDLICHTAFDQPPLTRTERVNNVKKRNYFTKYSEQTRKVLETLLDKYADEGIENIEDMKILQVKPLDVFGSPMEIVDLFGGKMGYLKALSELD